MRISTKALAIALAALAIAGVATPTFADLLGNLLGFPRVVFQGGNTNIENGSIHVNSAPIIFQESSVSPPRFINPAGQAGYESLDILVPVDAACNLTGNGTFVLVGEIDLDGDTVVDASGDLLVGTVTQLGFLDATATTDLFDFRISVTGGLLASLYDNEDIGILVQSENANFAGTCSQSTGEAKGTLGAIPPILPAEGCTPGYWKQKHHFDSWEGYAPTDLFADVFGRSAAGVDTLEDALRAGGGGIKALVRHSTASLLNASSGDVNAVAFTTTAEVIAAFQAAFDSGDFEPSKDAFEAANEEGCPLN
jgi:hypothetical protein